MRIMGKGHGHGGWMEDKKLAVENQAGKETGGYRYTCFILVVCVIVF